MRRSLFGKPEPEPVFSIRLAHVLVGIDLAVETFSGGEYEQSALRALRHEMRSEPIARVLARSGIRAAEERDQRCRKNQPLAVDVTALDVRQLVRDDKADCRLTLLSRQLDDFRVQDNEAPTEELRREGVEHATGLRHEHIRHFHLERATLLHDDLVQVRELPLRYADGIPAKPAEKDCVKHPEADAEHGAIDDQHARHRVSRDQSKDGPRVHEETQRNAESVVDALLGMHQLG